MDMEKFYNIFKKDVLSPRESQVSALILRGYSSAAIGARLSIAEATVKANRRSIHAKLGISSQAELFALFIEDIQFYH
jgi:DNA-binding CsgD family transcriptional regulator